jgi:hypothetical protein
MTTRDLSIRLSLKDGDAVRDGLRRLGDDGQKALQRIETASQPASKSLLALNAASGAARGGMEGLAGRAGALGGALQGMGGVGLAAAAGIGALTVALGAGLARAREAVRAFDGVAQAADRIGIATDALQELRFAGQQAGATTDQVDDALKELAIRAAEAAAGTGEAREAFDRLGISQDEVRANLGDLDGLFRLIAQRFSTLRTEADGVLTAEQLFGGAGGEYLVNLLRQGADRIAEFRDEARSLGLVIENDVLRRSQDMARQLDVASQVIETNLNSAFVDLAPILLSTAQLFADIARAVADLVDGFRDLENRSSRGLRERLQSLRTERDGLLAAPGAGLSPFVVGAPAVADAPRLREIEAEIERIEGILAGRDRAPPATRTPAPARLPASPETPAPRTPTPEARREEVDAVNDYVNSLRTSLELARMDEDQRRRTEAIMRAQALAMREGNSLTDEQAREIEGLVDATSRWERETQAAEDAQRRLQDAGRQIGLTFSSAFEEAILSGKSLRDVLEGMIEDVARLVIRLTVIEPLARSIAGALGGAGSGGGGGGGGGSTTGNIFGTIASAVIGSLFHGGGIAGEGSPETRTLPSAAWTDAPRYHGGGVAGLRPGEVPAILERGEGVFTREQMRALGDALSTPPAPVVPSVQVNVVNRSGTPVDAEQGTTRFDGEAMVLDVVLRAAQRPGPFRDGMRGAIA